MTPSSAVFIAALVSGCVAFVNRKKFFPEVFEQGIKSRKESYSQAVAFRETIKKRMDKDDKDGA